MSIPDQSIECQNPNCGWCLNAEREAEAERGLRCRACLDVFGERYPLPSEDDPTLCGHCFRISLAPKSPQVGMYGTRPVQRPPSDGLSDTETAQNASGVHRTADGGVER